MGRPLNIDRLAGATTADGLQLMVQAKIGTSAVGNASVIQQKSHSKFRCMNGASETSTCLLVDKASGSLLDDEMSITATGGVSGTPLDTPVIATVTSTIDNGGFLVDNTTYSYRVSAINALGETLASSAVTVLTGDSITNDTNTATITWSAVAGATGYKVYGRTGGTELLMATLGAVLTFVDDGSVTPAGALPGSNTTAPAATFRVKKVTNRFCWDFAGNRYMWSFDAPANGLVQLPSA